MTIFNTLLISLLSFSFAFTQTNSTTEPRYIQVKGSAEMSIPPDNIELQIALQEYTRLDKKIGLIKVEDKVKKILTKNSIPIDKLTFSNSSYNWYYWWQNRNRSIRRQNYTIKLQADTDFLQLVKDLNIKGVRSIRISNTSHQEIQKFRKEVKIAAIKAAKEKATYLLESVDENVGKVLFVKEMNENSWWARNNNLVSNVVVNSGDESGFDNVSDIKLRYEIEARFEIME